MTWNEHDRVKELYKKLSEGGLTKEEMEELVLILAKDFIERGYE